MILVSQLLGGSYAATTDKMTNLATKPLSRDDGLVARLVILSNMLHEPDGPRVRFPGAVRCEMFFES